jgi:hypothetical protein
MLAEAFILRLEANLRSGNEHAITSRDARFVPVPLPAPKKDKAAAGNPPK